MSGLPLCHGSKWLPKLSSPRVSRYVEEREHKANVHNVSRVSHGDMSGRVVQRSDPVELFGRHPIS